MIDQWYIRYKIDFRREGSETTGEAGDSGDFSMAKRDNVERMQGW